MLPRIVVAIIVLVHRSTGSGGVSGSSGSGSDLSGISRLWMLRGVLEFSVSDFGVVDRTVAA